jgi:hypothetical protein
VERESGRFSRGEHTCSRSGFADGVLSGPRGVGPDSGPRRWCALRGSSCPHRSRCQRGRTGRVVLGPFRARRLSSLLEPGGTLTLVEDRPPPRNRDALRAGSWLQRNGRHASRPARSPSAGTESRGARHRPCSGRSAGVPPDRGSSDRVSRRPIPGGGLLWRATVPRRPCWASRRARGSLRHWRSGPNTFASSCSRSISWRTTRPRCYSRR